MHDSKPRYAPTAILVDGKVQAVTEYVAHMPGQHPAGCIIRADLVALELRTAIGSRWYGFDEAWINSELRMVVLGFDARDVIRRKWDVVPKNKV